MKLQLLFNDTNEREVRMAEEINSHSCKSGYVKDILWQSLMEREKPKRAEPDLPTFNF